MRLSEELREVQGTCAMIKPEWVEHVARLEKLARLTSQIEHEVRILRAQNERVREEFH